MDQDFEGRVAIVTGGGNGMGERVAHTIASRGGQVVIFERDEAAGRRVADDIVAGGGTAVSLLVDVSLEEQVARGVAETVSRFGRIDAVDNNAAALDLTADDRDIASLDAALFTATIANDLLGPLLVTKHVLPHLIAAGSGSIVNMASVSGFAGEASLSAYGIAKAGVMQLTRAVATQYGPVGIRCNAIAPSYVTTRNNDQYAPPELAGIYARPTPLPRLVGPQDIADAVTFLLSDRASMISGQVLAVDGGFRAASPIVPEFVTTFG